MSEKADSQEVEIEEPIPPLVAAPIPGWVRIVTGIAGLAFSITGSAAAFITNNQAGTVALIALGAVLIFIAILGQQITRFKAGNYEVIFALLTQAKRELESGDEERADALVETAISQVHTTHYWPGYAGGNLLRPSFAEAITIRNLIRELNKLPDLRVHPEVQTGDVRFDAVIEYSGYRIAVEFKTTRSADVSSAIVGIIGMALRATPQPDGLLAVMIGPVSLTSLDLTKQKVAEGVSFPVEAIKLDSPYSYDPSPILDALTAIADRLKKRPSS
jgi:hypothetical protein